MLDILCNAVEQGKDEGTVMPDVNSVEITLSSGSIKRNLRG